MSQASPVSLDDQLCFDLYAASRAVTTRYRALLEPLGLTYPQYLVMLLLWEGSPLSVGEFSARLQLDSGTLSPLLKRLAAQGLVTRRRGDADERTVTVALTPAGRALRRRAARIPDRMCEAMGLAPVEFDRLQKLLRRLNSSVSSPTDISRPS